MGETTDRVLALTDGVDTLMQRSSDLANSVALGAVHVIDAMRKLRARRHDTTPPGARRVLIVEDDRTTLTALRRMAQEVSDFVDVAPSVRVARALIEEKPYDALVLDYVLANGHADEIIEAVRRRPNRRHAWIILMSARWDQEEGERHARRMNAHDFVAKPLRDVDEFQRRLARAFKGLEPRPYKGIVVGKTGWKPPPK